MDDEYSFASMQHPTAGYLFAEELGIYVMTLDDFCVDGCVGRKPATSTACFSDMTAPTAPCASPSSPSSVVYLSPFYPPSPLKAVDCPPAVAPEILRFSGAPDDIFIKPELVDFVVPLSTPTYPLQPVPVHVIHEAPTTDDRERLRRRQRGYEKRYRGRKRRDLKQQRDTWLALEMKLDATRQKHCKPFVRRASTSRRNQMLLLLQEERALRQDQVAMKTLQAWEEVSRIREYSDKDELRTLSEWRHSAEKVIGQCAMLGPRRFHPYAPMAPQHFTW
uniref:Uncharacterized protein n=1 Tax=Phytophthora ramorum TaxID=164328 RepID=H3GK85_PHYRM